LVGPRAEQASSLRRNRTHHRNLRNAHLVCVLCVPFASSALKHPIGGHYRVMKRVPERALSVTACLAAVACLLASFAGGCASEKEPAGASTAAAARSADRLALRPILLPDLSRVAGSVQVQVRERHTSLTQKLDNPAATLDELGAAYGELGQLLLAGEYFDAAESAFLNAYTLMPSDMRWPYYLGHIHRKRGNPAKAAAFLEETRTLQPDDVPTLVWLGSVYLEQGQPEAAEPPLTRALSLQPRAAAALFGLGKAALARKDYTRAVKYLE